MGRERQSRGYRQAGERDVRLRLLKKLDNNLTLYRSSNVLTIKDKINYNICAGVFACAYFYKSRIDIFRRSNELF